MDEQATEKIQDRTDGGEKEARQFQDIFKQYGQAILIGLGAAVLVFLGLAVYKNYKQAGNERAAQALFTATSPEQLQQVVAQHGSSPAAPLALIISASMAYQAGQYEMAQYTFSQFRQKYPNHLFAQTATVGIAQCLEALGQYDQALSAFEAFLTAHPKHYLAPSAVLSKGRCLEQMGRFDDAKTVYEDFIAANPETPWASQAESALLFVEMKRRAASGGGDSAATPAASVAGIKSTPEFEAVPAPTPVP